MAAPTGNQFWKMRSKHGRDKIFTDPEILWEACCEYFEWVESNPLYEEQVFNNKGEIVRAPVAKMRAMTIMGLCNFLNITPTTWYEYKGRKEYSEVITRAENIIREQKFTGAAAELLNANIIARDLGLKERRDVSSEDGSMTPKGLEAFYGNRDGSGDDESNAKS